MATIKRSKNKTDELLEKMCGKEAVVEKFKSKLSSKVGSIPQDESNEDEKQAAMPDVEVLVGNDAQKVDFNSKERKQLAENINKSVINYQKQVEKDEKAKMEIKEEDGQ